MSEQWINPPPVIDLSKLAQVEAVTSGVIALAAVSSNTATLTGWNASRTLVFPLGTSANSAAGAAIHNCLAHLTYTASGGNTVITATRTTTTGTITVGYIAVRLKYIGL